MTTYFEPHECVIFVQSTKIGTHENKAFHSTGTYIIVRPLIEYTNVQSLIEYKINVQSLIEYMYINIQSW